YGSYTSKTNVYVDHTTILKGVTSASAIADRLSQNLYNGLMPFTDRIRLMSYLTAGTLDTTRIRESFGLAVGSPSFQWY
ncbi:MAG: hypothetical protein K2Q20_09130, partial [Phycisphaerales bacterium]|nr:hypothetical protein [Phycisphaerales bacterium]